MLWGKIKKDGKKAGIGVSHTVSKEKILWDLELDEEFIEIEITPKA